MEKLSFEKAFEESEKIKRVVDNKEARDYREANLTVDLNNANSVLEEKEKELEEKDKELNEVWNTIEWLNEKHENLISEFKKILIESTTGLKRREMLYKDMEERISELFGVKNIKKISDEDSLALIKTKDPDDFKDEPLHVMLGDMSYLSLANEGGHRQGDELLSETGKTLKNEFADASRHGGDEFTTLVLLQKKDAEEKVARLEENIKKMKNISELARFGLNPNIDIGIAHFSEGLKVFQEIINIMEQDKTGKEKLAKLDILKEMQNIWVEIADKRSTIKKAQERIPVLLEKKKNNLEHYKELYKFLNKGAYGIDDSDLDDMNEKIKSGGSQDELIFEYIKEMELLNLEKRSGYEKAKETAILKTADNRIL